MKKHLLLLIYLLVTISSLAQERLYTDKEHGGVGNGVFGKINDEINVSPTGQLSYEIPIPALPGTGGMKPNLSEFISMLQQFHEKWFGWIWL